MAAQRDCPQHAGRPLILFCGKCIRPVCTACLIQQPGCPVAAHHPHEFSDLENVPAFLRNQLDSIQSQLNREQNAVLERAKSFANEAEKREDNFNSQVARVLQCTDEALQVLQQLQAAIRAAATSTIANVLRAGVESDGRKQQLEDMHARELACLQQSCTIARLRNLDDSSLLKEIEFVRNLIRCAEPTAASTPHPAPSPAEPVQVLSLSSFSDAKQSQIESQMQNIVKQGKQLIQSLSLGNIFDVCSNVTIPFSSCTK